jgi:hypothetical protein
MLATLTPTLSAISTTDTPTSDSFMFSGPHHSDHNPDRQENRLSTENDKSY